MKPKTYIGQHFLMDTSVIPYMIDAADLHGDDTVIEIGAGHGTLTHELAKHAEHVFAIEMDDECIPMLHSFFDEERHVRIVHDDVLRWWGERTKEQRIGNDSFQHLQYKIVANLPYGITSKVLRMFLEHEPRPSHMVVMVQREVAERITAPSGHMSLLSLAVQYYADAKIIARVPAEAFDPPPAVESAVVAIRVFTSEHDTEEERRVFQCARIGFASRRKQLHSLLAKPFQMTNDDVRTLLISIGASAQARAQELSVEQWKQLVEQIPFDKT